MREGPEAHGTAELGGIELLEAVTAEGRQRLAAGALLGRGCRPGDRVLVSLHSSASMICAVLGALRVGVVPVLLSPDLTPTERAVLAHDAEPSLDIGDEAALGELFAGAETDIAPLPLTRPMLYTSGTTGWPKGVTVGLFGEQRARAWYDDEVDLWAPRPGDVHLVCAPTSHSAPMRAAIATLLAGGTLAVMARFDAALVLAALRELRPTTTFMVPTHMERLLTAPGLGTDERFDSLRLLFHAGSACPAPLKRAMLARLAPGVLTEFYGSTEGQFTACSDAEWLARPGTVGRARPGRTLHIETGAAPPGAEGEAIGVIWCRAPAFARFSYWHQPDATAAAWDGDAFTVGDLGWLDDEGYLYIAGRREDLIITGGVNVYPAEVETAIAAFPGVGDVAVYGTPDEHWGERVCAAIVAERPIDGDALRADLAGRLAPAKRPKEYTLVGSLPRTPSVKLVRRALSTPGAPAGGPEAEKG